MREKNSAVSTISERLASSATRSISAWTRVPKRGPVGRFGFTGDLLDTNFSSLVEAGYRPGPCEFGRCRQRHRGLGAQRKQVRARARPILVFAPGAFGTFALLVGFQQLRLPKPHGFVHVELEHRRIPPHHAMIADFGRMQSWGHALWVAADRRRTVAHVLRAEFGTSGRFAFER